MDGNVEGRDPIYDAFPLKSAICVNSLMTVTINGDRREIPDGLTVAALLEHIGMPAERVAIERNLDILPRARWVETKVQPNDNYEIVHFVGGG